MRQFISEVFPDKNGILKLEEKDFPDLKNVIENTLKSKKLEKGRKEVKEECWCFENESAGKTVDYIIEKSKELKV